MSIEKFTMLTSSCVPIIADNIDTDQIIPARFLKRTSREGFGSFLFYDHRFINEGQKNIDFVLNNSLYKGEILLTGKNFGCGSSREHAPWAIMDYGFRAVISSSFADIFRLNSLNNGLLVIQLTQSYVNNLFEQIRNVHDTKLKIDLTEQTVQMESTGKLEKFDIDKHRKDCLLKGYDDIDYILSKRQLIEQYETNMNKFYQLIHKRK